MSQELVINSTSHESRLAVLDEGQVVELWVERQWQRTVVGNIYKGRVTKVLPGMQSAFVDIGLERDAFLYVSDIVEDLEEYEAEHTDDIHFEGAAPKPEASIADLLREGQEIAVQVAKESIAGKGARITTHITLPGRFLVYMPTVNHVGVSRRIENEEERLRLKTILDEIRNGSGGYIVRTAGEGRNREDFLTDMSYLKSLWEVIRKRSEKASSPTALHHDLDLVLRILRDVLSPDFKTVWVDSVEQYQRIVEFLDQIQPNLVSRVRLYRRDEPIFDAFGIEPEIERALKSKVWLKSGGYIVINQTEALVAIDVNTGKYVGKKNLEETVFRTNLEAIREIVRQVRLRDLGGIIVVDFIDMEHEENRAQVFHSLSEEIKKDRSKTKILQISEFGLIEMTRKRVRQSLERSLTQPCPYCGGSGRVKSNPTVTMELWRDLMKLRDLQEEQEIIIRVNPDVYSSLKDDPYGIFQEVEKTLNVHLVFKPDDNLHHEQFDVVMI